MIKAAFFDRDGTINVNFGHVYKKEDLVFVDGIPEIIKKYNDEGTIVIVVTNQAGIAKGLYSENDMHEFNRYLNKQLNAKYGAHIDKFYFCPHHPDFTGLCTCRKPLPGMFFKAANECNICLEKSVMYGDKDSDLIAARSAGILKTYLVKCKKKYRIKRDIL
ncbi:MAG: D-glycero-alpha-D-manno-heptose-1,7-bisphosphate 7-phosphatase [Aminipila sp.]